MPVRSWATIPRYPPTYVWPGRIQNRTVNVVVGHEKIGKGIWGSGLAGIVTTGGLMPDGTESCFGGPRSVLWVGPEDDPNTAQGYRLLAAGADLAQVFNYTDAFTITEGCPEMRDLLDEINDPRSKFNRSRVKAGLPVACPVGMLWIDPLSAVSPVSITNPNSHVRQHVLAPLEAVARDYDLAVLALVHDTKNGKVSGSKAITEAARVVLEIERKFVDSQAYGPLDIRLINVPMANNTADNLAPVGYTIVGTDVEGVNVGRAHYLPVPPEAIAYDDKPTPLKEKIVAVLRDGGMMKRAQIYEELCKADPELGVGETAVGAALSRMGQDPHSPVIKAEEKGYWTLIPVDGPIPGAGPLRPVLDEEEFIGQVEGYLRKHMNGGEDRDSLDGDDGEV